MISPMMKNSFRITILGIMMFAFAHTGASQTMELGLFGGGSYYIGDLNPVFHFNKTQLSYGAVARFNLSTRWAIKASYLHGKVKGDDQNAQVAAEQGLNFESGINDFAVVAEFNFWDYFTGSKRSYWTPYLFIGVGAFTFNPKSYNGDELQPLGTEGQNIGFDGRTPYKKWGVALPFGFGFKYSITEKIGMSLEWSIRKTFTDYIDDVSTTFYFDGPAADPNNEALVLSDPTLTHQAYMQRGNESTKDWVGFIGVSMTYKINLRSKLKCNLDGW